MVFDYARRRKSRENPKVVTVTVFLTLQARGMCRKISNTVSNDVIVCRSQAAVEWCTMHSAGQLAKAISNGVPIWNSVAFGNDCKTFSSFLGY